MPDDDDTLAHLGRRVEGRFRSVDDRVDATRTQIEHLRADVTDQIVRARRELARLMLWAMAASAILTAAMCLATLVILL